MAVTTYKNIQDRVTDILSKNDSTTINRIKNWINMGYSDFVLREQWPFREAVGDISTVQGTQEYTLSTEFTDIDENNITSVTLQGANNKKLTYWPYQQLRANAPDFDQAGQAVPRRYYLKSGKIGLWPVPNAVYTVTVDYYKVPTELSADSDEPIIPVNYRESLVHYALAMEHDFNTDPDLAIKSENKYEQKVTLARNNLLAQPNDTGAFTILGPAHSKDWLGLPGEGV